MSRHSLMIGSLVALAFLSSFQRPTRAAEFTAEVVEVAPGEETTDGVEILVRSPQGGARTLQRGAEWYIEFNLEGTSPDSVITIEAYQLNEAEVREDSTAVAEAVSFWEITPMDHEVGQGGYVRLYLPVELFAVARDVAGLALLVTAPGLSSYAIGAALGDARVVVLGAE